LISDLGHFFNEKICSMMKTMTVEFGESQPCNVLSGWSYQIVKKDSPNAPRDSPVLDPEVVITPGLVLGVVVEIVLVTGHLQGAVEVLSICLIQVVAVEKKQYNL
jgi:hypothetical protein